MPYIQTMQGMIITQNGRFVFRRHQNEYWAWSIYDDYSRGMTHKWKKLPEGTIIYFDIDNPPPTIPYLPILN